jgi:hypothetical protein
LQNQSVFSALFANSAYDDSSQKEANRLVSKTVGWSKLFRLDGNDEINQAGRRRIFVRSERR